MTEQPPLGDIRLICPRCNKDVGKIFRKTYWEIKKTVPKFMVYHPECEGIRYEEVGPEGVVGPT